MSGISQTLFGALASALKDTFFKYVSLLLSGNSPGKSVAAYNADASTNNLTVTQNGDVRNSTFTPFNAGYYSVYFDGAGDVLTTASSAANDFGTGDWTFELWINSTQTTRVDPIAWNYTFSSAGWAGLILNVAASGQMSWYENANQRINATSTGWNNGTWNHIAITRSGNSVRMFLNGTQVGSTYTTSFSYGANPSGFVIGLNSDGFTGPLAGYLSNIRIVKGTAVYTSNFTPSTTPLTAITNTSLLTCQSSRFIDNSTNNFTITRNGDAAIVSAQPFTLPAVNTTYGSGYFDGSGDYLDISSTATLTPAGDFTIEFWVYPTQFAVNPGNVIEWYSKGYGIQIYTTNGGWGAAYSSANNGTYYLSGSFGFGALNQWQHVAVYRSGNNYYGALNGVVTLLGTSSSAPSTGSDPVRIGDFSGVAQYPARGYISNVRYVNGTAVYGASNFILPTAPLTAITNTQLLTLQSDFSSRNSGFIDDSINNFTITRNGNTTQGTFTPYGPNWSNYFDGTGDYLSGIGTTSSFNFMHNSTALFTFECWVYTTSTSLQNLLDNCGTTTANVGVNLYFDSTGINLLISRGVAGVGNAVIFVASTSAVPTNQWVHIAVTYDQSQASSNAKFYINGAASGTGNKTANAPSGSNATNAMTVAGATGGGSPIVGYLSNLRITNSIVYTSAFTPPTAPLTAITNTSLLTCQSNRFIDNSTNAFTITKNGDVSVQRFSPFSPSAAYAAADIGGSGYFDEVGDYLTAPVSTNMSLGTGDFTIECWVRFAVSTVGNGQGVYQLSNGYLNSAVRGPALGVENSVGDWTIYYGTTFTQSGTVPTSGVWYHTALVRSSDTTKLYVDGTSIISVADTTNYTDQYFTIGGWYSTGFLLNGYISNLRVVKGTAVYTSNFTPPTAPLTAITNTQLLLNFTNAGIIDNAMLNDLETVGNAQISTAQSKFGGASLYVNAAAANTDYFVTPASQSWNFGTGNFTIEFWMYPNSTTTSWTDNATILDTDSSSGTGTDWWVVHQVNATIVFASNSATILSSSSVLVATTWQHVAIVRAAGTVTIYVNGTSAGSVAYATTIGGTRRLFITTQPGSLRWYKGYIDDLRITKGVARYTANFTPPAQAFPTS